MMDTNPEKEAGSYGGTRVDEMLPPELVEQLIQKLTPGERRSHSPRRVSRMAITAEMLHDRDDQMGEVNERA